MRFLATTLLAILASVGATIGYVLIVAPAQAHARITRDLTELLGLIPDGDARTALAARASRAEAYADRLSARLPGPPRRDLRPLIAAMYVRCSLAVAALPVALGMLLLGITAGLLRRHRLREEYGFASLTFSYVGKMIVALSVALYVFTALSPLGPPLWAVYATALSATAGATLFVGNLPPKI